MKTSVFVLVLGLVLLFAVSFATEMEESARECGKFMWKCKNSNDCCKDLVCSSRWKWCVLASPF
uniref:Kappa-theraphotoxin-Gr3a n=1 Tax=Grammostola rosea TaxID=432528 RepID=VSTX1_GRARO|nr:RecName: Full=Kappa-theraphotoxin-Gr3a; Short=Kappa-TRTX-Gr3a; AltName: Full=Voltage sensor toxin 1; Short=VsTx1; Flags: Precursor [Grammostola rosea]BAN13490.1 VSTx1 [Grammostola rosea]